MKTKELIKIIDEGLTPTIKFTKSVNNIDHPFEPEILGKIISYKNHDKFEDGDQVIEFVIDISDFVDYNKQIAEKHKDWYDENGNPTLSWFETDHYPKDHKETVYEMVTEKFKDSDLVYFEVIKISKWFEQYQKQTVIKNYVEFLECKLNQYELSTDNG